MNAKQRAARDRLIAEQRESSVIPRDPWHLEALPAVGDRISVRSGTQVGTIVEVLPRVGQVILQVDLDDGTAAKIIRPVR